MKIKSVNPLSRETTWFDFCGIVAKLAMVMSLPLESQCFHMDFSAELDRGTRCDRNRWI